MKMNTQTYETLSKAVHQVIEEQGKNWEAYQRADQTHERYRWDLLHSTGLNLYRLQTDLFDNHIDTALRKITKELGVGY